MVLDHRYQKLDPVRDFLSSAVYPLQWVVNAPVRLTFQCHGYFVSRHHLLKETETLQQTLFSQNAQLLKLKALEAENQRLHALLSASPRVGETLRVAEIIQVDADPFSQNILINKGRRDNVVIGQPIIDDQGVMGEIVEIHANTSRAILLTDPSHAIPVENVRNGVRGIIVGTGVVDGLELQYVPTTADIKEGDVLVTSGLGGRYPPGYPVGMVSQINQDKRESFASIRVQPAARLGQGRQLLLVECQKPLLLDAAPLEPLPAVQQSTAPMEQPCATH